MLKIFIAIFMITMIFILLCIVVMSIGYIIQKKQIKGSCGGIATNSLTKNNQDINSGAECSYCKKPINSCENEK